MSLNLFNKESDLILQRVYNLSPKEYNVVKNGLEIIRAVIGPEVTSIDPNKNKSNKSVVENGDSPQSSSKAVETQTEPNSTLLTKYSDKSKNRLADVVQIVKNLNTENAELTDRVNELTERVESLEATNKTLAEQLSKLETIQKADIASMRTLIEVLRKELEEFKSNVSKQREDDEESEV